MFTGTRMVHRIGGLHGNDNRAYERNEKGRSYQAYGNVRNLPRNHQAVRYRYAERDVSQWDAFVKGEYENLKRDF